MSTDVRALVAAHPHGIPEGPAAIHFCPVPGCLDIWESEATCEHADLIPPCGHVVIEPGCGGCDPGAIEFVITDDGERRPFDSAIDLDPRTVHPADAADTHTTGAGA